MNQANTISLSHWLNSDTPTYGDQGGFTRNSISSIKKGRTANSESWNFNNHIGTHIDFPRHFFENGKSSSDYQKPFFVFNKIGFIELSTVQKPGSVIYAKDIENQLEILDPEIDILLLKTNFEKHRGSDVYWKENLGFDPELATLFRDRFKGLKAFGFDSISLTSVMHREIGAKAHKNFLGEEQAILIIEDMHLSKLSEVTKFERLIVASFPVENADGTPVNCLLETA
jgi:arylformamidase